MKKEDDVRETPHDKFAAINSVIPGGFTLDVCATHENAKCKRYYTEHDGLCEKLDAKGSYEVFSDQVPPETGNGLTGSWAGERCWCNPPYSDINSWVRKAWVSAEAELVVMLVPSTRTEQRWWQDLIEPYRDGNDLRRGVFGCPGLSVDRNWRLAVKFQADRWNFLKDGKPILCEKVGSKQFGKPSSPKFGVCLLIWHHV